MDTKFEIIIYVRKVLGPFYCGGDYMSNRCRKHNTDKAGDGIIAIIILAIIMMPIVGAYLLFFGKMKNNEELV